MDLAAKFAQRTAAAQENAAKSEAENVDTNSRLHFSHGFAIMGTHQMTKLPKSSRTTCGPTLFSISLFLTSKSKTATTKRKMTWTGKRRLMSQLSSLKKRKKNLKRLRTAKARKRRSPATTMRLKMPLVLVPLLLPPLSKWRHLRNFRRDRKWVAGDC